MCCLSGVECCVPPGSRVVVSSVLDVLTGGREGRMISPAMNYISPGSGVASLLPPPSHGSESHNRCLVIHFTLSRHGVCLELWSGFNTGQEREGEDMSCYQSDRTELCKSNVNINLTDVPHFQIHLV